MEFSNNVLPTIALAGILSGILLFALSLLLFHILLQRRKARAGKSGSNHHPSWSSSRSQRRSDLALNSTKDVDAEEEGGGLDGEEKKSGGERASSLYLEPNQPLYVDVDVDVESESNGRGPHAGMQFILTPPTPGK